MKHKQLKISRKINENYEKLNELSKNVDENYDKWLVMKENLQ